MQNVRMMLRAKRPKFFHVAASVVEYLPAFRPDIFRSDFDNRAAGLAAMNRADCKAGFCASIGRRGYGAELVCHLIPSSVLITASIAAVAFCNSDNILYIVAGGIDKDPIGCVSFAPT
jgi:hypothetical protein